MLTERIDINMMLVALLPRSGSFNKHAQLAAEKRGGTAKTLRFFVCPWRGRYA